MSLTSYANPPTAPPTAPPSKAVTVAVWGDSRENDERLGSFQAGGDEIMQRPV